MGSPAEVREQYGVCSRCARGGHTANNCPRGKAVPSTVKAPRGKRHTTSAPPVAKTPASAVATDSPKEAHTAAVASVLVVAEKPSVAKAIADLMSGGRCRVRQPPDGLAPMCRYHEFFTHFKPAGGKCSIRATSVIGHMASLDFNEDTGNNPLHLVSANT